MAKQGNIGIIVSFAVLATLCPWQNACAPKTKRDDRHAITGIIDSVDPSKNQLLIDHQTIPGFMPAMEMQYRVRDAEMLRGLAAGDKITAQVEIVNGATWIGNIVVIDRGGEKKPRPVIEFHQPTLGNEIPNFVLVNQDGKEISLDQYKGKAVLLTFIYTRCPLPDYCPLLTRNFAAINRALAKDPKTYARTHLLSISFDPEHDTPPVLRAYGARYAPPGKRAFDHWEFAVASPVETARMARFLGLQYNQESGQIIHSLSTAIISSDGKLYKWYDDNTWAPEDMLKQLLSSLGAPTSS